MLGFKQIPIRKKAMGRSIQQRALWSERSGFESWLCHFINYLTALSSGFLISKMGIKLLQEDLLLRLMR